ncbi:MAG: hypothetical protein JNL32_02015 [Candidatus Kapabacteria bacterium]|nr:hypothetical protein [Candidatus Kapabacteria bacterium]
MKIQLLITAIILSITSALPLRSQSVAGYSFQDYCVALNLSQKSIAHSITLIPTMIDPCTNFTIPTDTNFVRKCDSTWNDNIFDSHGFGNSWKEVFLIVEVLRIDVVKRRYSLLVLKDLTGFVPDSTVLDLSPDEVPFGLESVQQINAFNKEKIKAPAYSTTKYLFSTTLQRKTIKNKVVYEHTMLIFSFHRIHTFPMDSSVGQQIKMKDSVTQQRNTTDYTGFFIRCDECFPTSTVVITTQLHGEMFYHEKNMYPKRFVLLDALNEFLTIAKMRQDRNKRKH